MDDTLRLCRFTIHRKDGTAVYEVAYNGASPPRDLSPRDFVVGEDGWFLSYAGPAGANFVQRGALLAPVYVEWVDGEIRAHGLVLRLA